MEDAHKLVILKSEDGYYWQIDTEFGDPEEKSQPYADFDKCLMNFLIWYHDRKDDIGPVEFEQFLN